MSRRYNLSVVFAGLFLLACHATKHNLHSSVEKSDALKPIKIDMKNLVDSIDSYDGKFIETVGFYVSGFEASDLFYDTTIMGYRNGLWIENFKCKPPNDFGTKMIKVTMRGTLDKSIQGHMNAFKAGLVDVCYVDTVR